MLGKFIGDNQCEMILVVLYQFSFEISILEG